MKKVLEAKQAKIGPKITFFCHFPKFGSLVLQQIEEDDSLEQCLTTNVKKSFGSPDLGQTDLNQAHEIFHHFLECG